MKKLFLSICLITSVNLCSAGSNIERISSSGVGARHETTIDMPYGDLDEVLIDDRSYTKKLSSKLPSRASCLKAAGTMLFAGAVFGIGFLTCHLTQGSNYYSSGVSGNTTDINGAAINGANLTLPLIFKPIEGISPPKNQPTNRPKNIIKKNLQMCDANYNWPGVPFALDVCDISEAPKNITFDCDEFFIGPKTEECSALVPTSILSPLNDHNNKYIDLKTKAGTEMLAIADTNMINESLTDNDTPLGNNLDEGNFTCAPNHIQRIIVASNGTAYPECSKDPLREVCEYDWIKMNRPFRKLYF